MSEVTVPVFSDFIVPLLDKVIEFVNFRIPHALVEGKLNPWFQPELSFAIRGGDMNMKPRFFSGEKEKPVLMVAKDRRTHRGETNTISLPRKEARPAFGPRS
jgi:hypothetical protein